MLSMIREKAVDQTVEFYMIWDTDKSMSRYHNELGLCGQFCNLIANQILPDISL